MCAICSVSIPLSLSLSLSLQISALLRVASLPDHLFLFNHLLRSPPGVGEWAINYLQPLSPFKHEGSIRQVHTNNYGKYK